MSNLKKYFLPLMFTAIGIFLGVGIYTFIYAKGYSYMSDDPKSCVNCHVMRENYSSWNSASHRDIACNGCHTPDNIIRKYLVKAENGFNHSWAFTFGPPEVIQIKSRSTNVVEDNCIRCHKETLSAVFVQTHKNRQRCFTCHQSVGHSF
ncbi:MAG: cytochrome c nitrite reductase small subunit [Bacteroidota bacterium]|nr:cytochrome c nitrite reductase small subunit [Bacteroidota bacterium]